METTNVRGHPRTNRSGAVSLVKSHQRKKSGKLQRFGEGLKKVGGYVGHELYEHLAPEEIRRTVSTQKEKETLELLKHEKDLLKARETIEEKLQTLMDAWDARVDAGYIDYDQVFKNMEKMINNYVKSIDGIDKALTAAQKGRVKFPPEYIQPEGGYSMETLSVEPIDLGGPVLDRNEEQQVEFV